MSLCIPKLVKACKSYEAMEKRFGNSPSRGSAQRPRLMSMVSIMIVELFDSRDVLPANQDLINEVPNIDVVA